MPMMKAIGVIPSRYASTRLPGKPLIKIAGKPLVQWVYEAATKSGRLSEVIVATDDDRIAEAVTAFGGEAVMTSPDLPSGTDRVAAAMAGRDADIIANLQGDEPLMDPRNIDLAIDALADDNDSHVASAMIRLESEVDFLSPHVVKVVCDGRGSAMYFSRAPIPDSSRISESDRFQAAPRMKHLGLYVYRRDVLDCIVQLPTSPYEFTEKLEQLRFLEAGFRIRMVEVSTDSIGVDTPEDVAKVEQIMASR